MAKSNISAEQKKALGERIRSHRRYRGMTQKELASASGVRGDGIYRYETGQSYPTDVQILAIADALHVPATELENRKFCSVPQVMYGSVCWELAVNDWRDRTVDEIAAELGVAEKTVSGAKFKLKQRGFGALYTARQPCTGKRLDPPKAPSRRVDSSQCRSCRYRSSLGCCDYYQMTGYRRPTPVDGVCPARVAGRRRRGRLD